MYTHLCRFTVTSIVRNVFFLKYFYRMQEIKSATDIPFSRKNNHRNILKVKIVKVKISYIVENMFTIFSLML